MEFENNIVLDRGNEVLEGNLVNLGGAIDRNPGVVEAADPWAVEDAIEGVAAGNIFVEECDMQELHVLRTIGRVAIYLFLLMR